jgi:hypothetical protein
MKIEKFETLPWGLCSDCLERMTKGGTYDVVELAPGVRQISAYCAHREVGATMLVRPNRAQQWHLRTPIDAIEWEQLQALRAPMMSAALKVMIHDTSPEEPAGKAH